ncbi:MAG TPA: alpha/beta family hydrolase [Burkholderiaceae bacterium]|nr:alpha/beta family hydrolase [Burkholderiaceae bacterium]
MTERLRIAIDSGQAVSGLLESPPSPLACYVFGHGAGAGMEHPFMTRVATGLAERGIATLRYQFPYMERGVRRPDVPKVAHAAVRAAVAEAAQRQPRLPLIAGGKSFGARMTSQAQSASPLPGVVGLLFFGFPLHPAGKPSIDRAQHLAGVKVPMLFVQGTRDELADASLIEPTVEALHSHAALHWVPEGDHSLHVPARSGRSDTEVLDAALGAVRAWVERILER